MATISSAGIGSGLDVSTIVTQLMAVEKAPLQQMQTEATKFQNKLSAYGKIQSYVSSLRDAAQKLTNSSTWGDTTATSSDSSVAGVSTDSSAVAGSYSLTVSQLASSQSLASKAWPATTTSLGSGTLRIEMGAWASGAPPTFTPTTTSSAVNVQVLATDTLSDVRDKINAAKAGVMASIVTDASGSRLVMASSETGSANGFRVNASDDDGNDTDAAGLSALAYDPSQAIASMSQTQAATDAKATVNGLDITSSSNLLTGAISGVSLQLSKTTSAPVTLTVASNTESIQKAVVAFTDAYNNLNKYLADQTKYDAANKTGGTLQGDSGTNALRSAMRGIVGGTLGIGSAFQRLAQVGIQPGSDGTLSVDATKLSSAIKGKLADVKALFAATDSVTAENNGYATQLRQWGDKLLSFDGSLSTRTQSLQRQIDANSKQQSKFSDRMTSVETRLRAQYTALDTQMGKLTSLSNYMTQQLTALNNSNSSSK